MRLNFVIGSGIDTKNQDYKTAYPVNCSPYQLEGQGEDMFYMRSIPGIQDAGETEGRCTGGIYNPIERCIYRMNGTSLQKESGGNLTTLMQDLSVGTFTRMAYSRKSICFVTQGIAYIYDYNGDLKQIGTGFDAQPDESTSVQGEFVDVEQVGIRYALVSKNYDGFYITDLKDETIIDQDSPQISAEASSDETMGISSSQGQMVVFGRNTTQYFNITGDRNFKYVANKYIEAGICATTAYTKVKGTHAGVGCIFEQPETVWIAGAATATDIADNSLKREIRDFKQKSNNSLDSVKLEFIAFDDKETLVLYLGNKTFGYDWNAKVWYRISSSTTGGLPYRGIYHLYDETIGKWSVGDNVQDRYGHLDSSITRHFDSKVSNVMFTNNAKFGRNTVIKSMKMENVDGYENNIERVGISYSRDGVRFNPPKQHEYSAPNAYNQEFCIYNYGFVNKNAYFRLQFINDKPISISGLRINE